MEATDPVTGQPLPPDSIQRVLYISPSVHIYNIPPLTSTKGYIAASWTANNNKRQIFTARLRILETAIPSPLELSGDKLRADVLLEDPENGQLFAAAPYTQLEIVQQALDSSRFFAIRVQDGSGRKATLGLGFEDRSEAFDFRVVLQEVNKALGFGDSQKFESRSPEEPKKEEKRDFSLKEGEMVTVSLGRRGRQKLEEKKARDATNAEPRKLSPPNLGAFLPPPPSAEEVKKRKRLSATFQPPNPQEQSNEELGFDNGEFGEFQ